MQKIQKRSSEKKKTQITLHGPKSMDKFYDQYMIDGCSNNSQKFNLKQVIVLVLEIFQWNRLTLNQTQTIYQLLVV